MTQQIVDLIFSIIRDNIDDHSIDDKIQAMCLGMSSALAVIAEASEQMLSEFDMISYVCEHARIKYKKLSTLNVDKYVNNKRN